jgi:hypothetical protein
MHRRTPTIALLAFILSLAPSQAGAAEYRVEQCGATTSAHDFVAASLDPALYARDTCSTNSGLSVYGVPGAHVIPYGAVAWVATAPDGTTFSRWEASFLGGTGGASTAVYARACWDAWCTTPGYMFFGIENWGISANKQWEGSGATALQFVLQCSFGASGGCNLRSTAPGGSMFAPKMVLTDHFGPSSPQLVEDDLPGPSWQSGWHQHHVSFDALDRGGGIDHVSVTVDTAVAATWNAPCDRAAGVYTRLRPCPLSASASVPLTLSSFSDGSHDIWLTASDAAGQISTSGPYRLLVDNTAPVAPRNLTVENGEAWRSRDGFAITWDNPAQQHAPIAAVRWRLCPTGGGSCRTGRRSGTSISSLDGVALQQAGEYTLRAWLEDAAGNQDEANAATATLRFDPDAPRLAFAQNDPANPLQIAVAVDDPLSGLANGEIEMRRQGTGTWEALQTQASAARLLAYVDDERLRNGTYEFRAHAVDHAGNLAETDRRRDGARAAMSLPVRIVTRLRAGVRHVQLRPVRGRTVRRKVSVLVPHARTKPGRPVLISGVLTNYEGNPLADVSLAVLSAGWYDTADFRPIAQLRTDASGRFTYRARADQSRVLRFHYAGSAQVRAAATDVTIGVVATSTIHASDQSVRNGASVTFSGRLGSLPVPTGGKLIEIQAFFRGRWRTFSTVRSDGLGRWSFPYEFGGTVGKVVYRFRVRIPHEGGYPFESGNSSTMPVTVHGP